MRDLPTGTVTFLFTDVEGSTRLLDDLGEGYVDALAEHRRIVRAACALYGGVEVDTQGDAFFMAFAAAGAAVRAAADAQAGLASGPIRVRMGLHTGEPIVWAEGYAGVDVHRGARICAAAHGDQVVLSERIAALVDGVGLRPLGLHRLKDLSAPQPLFQLGEAVFPPLRTLHATNLPAQPSPLIGRERELGEVIAAMRDHIRLLTITGPGGGGKTRLALQVAAELAGDFPDGVFWVPLAGVGEAELVLSTVTAVISAQNDLAEHIGARRMLLLLDNFEQVLEAAPATGDLLGRCPNLRLLVTSRAALRIAGEREYRIESMPETDAVRLFTERARAIAADFEPDASVAAICDRLDRLPLAIELAAARIRVLDPGQLLGRLEQRLPLLTGGPRDAPERQRTLRATILWSHDLLRPEEQRLFADLAVFAGSFELEAAEAVCDASVDLIGDLVEQSLLRRWASGRFGLLETVREFALEQLAEAGRSDGLAAAHLDYFLAVAESAEVRGETHPTEWLNRLDAERDNFRTAMRFGLEHGRPVLALRLAIALGRFWVVRAHREGYAWLSEALAAAPDAPAPVRAAGLMWAGSTVFFTGDHDRANALGKEALALFRRLGDRRNTARALDRLAATEDPVRARALADESLALFREVGDRAGSLHPLSKVASDERRHGNAELGVTLTREALALAQEVGDSWWAAGLLADLADMAWEDGDLAAATALSRECVSLGHELGNAWTMLAGLGLLAALAAEQGDAARAGRLWGAVEALEASGGTPLDPGFEARCTVALGRLPAAELEPGRVAGRAMALDDAVRVAIASD